jgi:AI-2 transport protein TqsA
MIPNVPFSSTTRWGVNVLLLLAGVIALHLAQSVIVPMLIALMLAAALGPAAAWLQQIVKIRWSLACMLVVLGLLLLMALLTAIFGVATSRLAIDLPRPTDDDGIRMLYRKFVGRIEEISPIPIDGPLEPDNPDNLKLKLEDIKLANEERVIEYLRGLGPTIMGEIARYTSGWLWQSIIILFMLLFVLLEARMLARRVVAIFGPSPEVQAKAGEVLIAMANQVRTYLINRTLLNFALALVMGAIYYSFGVKQWLAWAVFLGILNYIPYLGPIVAGLPPFVDAFLFVGPGHAIAITIIYAVVITLESYVAFPIFLGRALDLNATTVMLACLFWDLVWGTTGLFLVMPIMAGIKAMLYHIPDGRAWADLMSTSDEPPKPPAIPLEAGNGNGNGVPEPAAVAAKQFTPDVP